MYTMNSDHHSMNHTEERIIESYQFALCENDSERTDYDEDRYASEIAWPY